MIISYSREQNRIIARLTFRKHGGSIWLSRDHEVSR